MLNGWYLSCLFEKKEWIIKNVLFTGYLLVVTVWFFIELVCKPIFHRAEKPAICLSNLILQTEWPLSSQMTTSSFKQALCFFVKDFFTFLLNGLKVIDFYSSLVMYSLYMKPNSSKIWCWTVILKCMYMHLLLPCLIFFEYILGKYKGPLFEC